MSPAAAFLWIRPKLLKNCLTFFKDGMTTSELFSAVIMNTLALTSVDEPDWKNVAGRLKLFELYRKIRSLRGTPKNASPYNYPEFLDYAVANGIYTPELKKQIYGRRNKHCRLFYQARIRFGLRLCRNQPSH